MQSIVNSRLAVKLRRAAKLWHDRTGTAAVEFAGVLPLLLIMFLGAIEITQGVSIDRKVTQTVRTVTDLASQSIVISNSEMTNIMNAATSVLTPYATGPLKLKITAVDISNGGLGTVAWSDALNTTKRATGSAVTVPAGVAVPGVQLIMGEVEYDYNPAFGYVLLGNITLSEQSYVRPRQSASITRSN